MSNVMHEGSDAPDNPAICQICGEPMPKGEEMFYYHGYSGPCPKPPLPKRLGRCNMNSDLHEKTCGCIDWKAE